MTWTHRGPVIQPGCLGSNPAGSSATYIERVLKNNDCAMAVLEANWHLVDSRDMAVFSRFQVDYTRFVVEVKSGKQSRVPLSIVLKLGPISYMRPEFISRINSSFHEKQKELQKLRCDNSPHCQATEQPRSISILKSFLQPNAL